MRSGPVIFFLLLLFASVSRAQNVTSATAARYFENWYRCHPSVPLDIRISRNCPNCPQPGEMVPASVTPLAAAVEASCLPSPEAGLSLFSSQLAAPYMWQRDSVICFCLQSGNGSPLEREQYAQGNRSQEARDAIIAASENSIRTDFQGELRSRYTRERYQSAASAMSYVTSAEDAIDLASRYTEVFGAASESEVSGAVAIAGAAGAALMRAEPSHVQTAYTYAAYENANGDFSSLTAELPAGSNLCIPYRHFVSHSQVPDDSDFYEGLASDEWNYQNLMQSLSRSVGVRPLSYISETPELRRTHSRIRFLYNNPILRNVLLSDNTAAKNRVVEMIRSMPRPSCQTGACKRDEAWVENMRTYQRNMAGLLADPEIIAANAAGARTAGLMNYLIAGENARMISMASQSLIDHEELLSPASWRPYCEARPRLDANSGLFHFMGEVEGDFGVRDFQNPTNDRYFQEMNDQICTKERRNPDTGRSESFNEFLARECPQRTGPRCGIDNRGNLIAEFMDSYSEVVDPVDQGLVSQIDPFIRGEVGGPRSMTSTDTAALTQAVRDPVRRSRPVTFTSNDYANLTRENRGPAQTTANNASQTRSTAVEQTRTPASPLPAQADHAVINPVSPVFQPVQGASGVAPVETPAALRSTIAQRQSESRAISDEIASLRETLIREQPNMNSRELADINTRIQNFERSIQQKDREIAGLQERLLAAEARPQPSRRREDAAAVPEPVSRRFVPSVAQQSVQGQPQGSGLPLPPTPLAASSAGGPVPASSVARAAPPASAPRTTGLARFGIRESVTQNGITVAPSSSTIDYQLLRSQSGSNILPITVTVEEFNRIAANDQGALSRYLDQVRALPGEVVKIDLRTDGNQSLELFVVKNGNEISIVQGPGINRAIATTPESVEPVDRARLDVLRREVVTGN